MRKAGILDNLQRIKKGAVDAYGEGYDDRYIAYKRGREAQGFDPEGPRINTTLGTNRTLTALRDMLNISNPEQRKVREEMGMGLSSDGYTRAGQMLGYLGSDLTQDTSRAIWWLVNAPQAVANIASEFGVHAVNPRLYNQKEFMYRKGSDGKDTLDMLPYAQKGADFDEAVEQGYMSPGGQLRKGYKQQTIEGTPYIYKRKYDPGYVASLAIPTGLAMNTGLGLMTPFGGAEGYKAALPSEEDPSKTNNVIGEVAGKYILGRTGQLLPWNEFKQVRPDVSKDEYMRYKAFKFDKDEDYNPLDGNASALMGAVKYTDEGVHGPEVQFLGRSIPATTGILPTATALAGTVAGVMNKRRPVISGFGGGMAGFAAGQLAGNALEQERRRRNQAENERDKMERLGE